MSENRESSTRSGTSASEWLSVSQAAAALGISERQARRDAKRLKADDRHDAGHNRQNAGHMAGHDAGHKSGSRPALVRLQALRDVRENAVSRSKFPAPDIQTDIMPDMTDKVSDIAPDTIEPDAGHNAGHMTGALLSQLQSENAFLRVQVEAANRQAAEATAALREYLKMQNKALPDAQSSTRYDGETSHNVGAETPQISATGKVSQTTKSAAQNNARREMRPLWKVILGVR
jgi:hypothetical protein